MKKISFSNIKDMLSRDEMRQVKGGSGGTCGWRDPYTGQGLCGYSKAQIHDWYHNWGGNWVCESCGSTSYCG
jgi:natural product precursor